MNTESIKLKAQQVRQNYLKWRAQRRSGKDSLEPPTIVDVIPGDIDGLMPIAALAADIKIEIPDWRPSIPPGKTETLVVEWKLGTDPDYTLLFTESVPAENLPDFPLARAIPQTFFQGREGRFDFRYGVKGWNDDEIAYIAPVPITLDRTAPYETESDPTPLAPVVPEPITDVELAAGVTVTIPDFDEDKKESVRVALVWSNTVPPENTPITPDVDMLLPANRIIPINRALIERFPSGDHYVAYELFDKAGNRSRTSYVHTAAVALGPLPDKLKSPIVPLADDDGLVDLMDAHTGVVVLIPAFENYQPADNIVVKWGNSTLAGVPIGERPPFPDPLSVSVIWSYLAAEYTDDPNDQTTPVTYDIVRGTTPFPLPAADGIEVNVNFAYTGPDNPDVPEPVNPLLAPVEIRGPSGTLNELINSDLGQNATASVTVYNPPADGDVITVFWKGVAVAETVTLDGTETVGDVVTINVLWTEIEAGLSDTVPVYYTLSHPDFVNDQRSIDTPVVVADLPIVLDPAAFMHLNDPGGGLMLNCNSLRKRASDSAYGYWVHIPASPHLVGPGTIDLVWLLKDGAGVEVPTSRLEATETIPEDSDTKGMDWFITPYDPHILSSWTIPDKWAMGEVVYTLTINSTPISSTALPELVGLQDLTAPEGGTCDLMVVPEFP